MVVPSESPEEITRHFKTITEKDGTEELEEQESTTGPVPPPDVLTPPEKEEE